MPLGSSSAAPVTTPGPTSRAISSTALPVRSISDGEVLTPRMLNLKPMPQALRGEFASGIPRQAKCFGDRRPKQQIAERIQDQRERAFGDVMILMAHRQLRDETADRIQEINQSIAVGEDHPRCESSGPLTAKCVETLVDDHSRVGFSGAGALNRFGDARGYRTGDRLGQLALKAGSGAEVMEEVGVRSPNPRRDSLERDGPRGPRCEVALERPQARRSGSPGLSRFRVIDTTVSYATLSL